MGISSNTLHLRSRASDVAIRAYGTLLRRRGYRLRASSGVPHYLETHDEPVFRRILVSREMNGWITIIDQRFDEQELRHIDRMTGEMSTAMGCPAVSFVLHDSEALYLFHWDGGKRLDRWCSWPGWYADGAVADKVRNRWRGRPDRLLPLCREGVADEYLQRLMRDYSADERDGVVFAEDVLGELHDALGIDCGPRTYASLHTQTNGLYLAVPGDERTLRIDRDQATDAYWENFTHLHFVRL